MRATSELLEDNKIRIAVEVDEDEVEAAVARTAKTLAREVRIPSRSVGPDILFPKSTRRTSSTFRPMMERDSM